MSRAIIVGVAGILLATDEWAVTFVGKSTRLAAPGAEPKG